LTPGGARTENDALHRPPPRTVDSRTGQRMDWADHARWVER
jgi:hypothetical protein